MSKINGIGVSEGFAKAKTFILKEKSLIISETKVKNSEKEFLFLQEKIKITKSQIQKIKEFATKKLGEDKAKVFDAHIAILEDPEFIQQVKNEIFSNKLNAPRATKIISKQFIAIFQSMDDDYMRERASDIKDVTDRLIKNLLDIEIQDLSLINVPVIVVAHDLTPSQTAQLNLEYVKGFITEIGGKTSHSAIMARTLRLPAIVGCGKEIFSLKEVIIDGGEGVIIYDFNNKQIKEHEQKLRKHLEKLEIEKNFKDKPSKTKDGWETKIVANIGNLHDAKEALKNGAEGVGLFRTEFLYMDSSNWPSENEQFEAYKNVLQAMENKRVVIRTLDIGGDKKISYYDFPNEMNPFLGYRAIRLQLNEIKIFNTQLRALLRASTYGNLAINFPMIATIDEIKEVIKNIKRVKKELTSEGKKVGNFTIGIMVEIPAAAEMIDKFSKYVDFFSIGTNDLIQYTFAADRMNEKVAYLYQPLNPAILRKLNSVITMAHKNNKPVGICGEVASEPLLLPLLVGMELDEFSMTSSAITSIRMDLSKMNKKNTKELLNQALDCETEEEVKDLLNKFYLENK